MPTVAELTAVYGNFMLGLRPGPGVCRRCFNVTDGYDRCYACTRSANHLDAIAPISYSIGHEQLHHALAGYKRLPASVARRFEVELAAVLWRHLQTHESCVARAAGTEAFAVVTTVPSSTREHDDTHPLHRIVARLVGPTRERHTRLLRRSEKAVAPHTFDAQKYVTATALAGESVLVIDDTWTTGANAQSAAAALQAAGAGPVAAVVIGRYVNRDWHHTDRHLRSLGTPFDWDRCIFCPPESGATGPPHEQRLASGRQG